MMGAEGRRGEAIPRDTVPERGQVSENGAKVSRSKQAWNVLQERVAGSYVANDPAGLGPHVSIVIGAESLTGSAEGLAGKPAGDDVNASAPSSTVKGLDVIPDGEGVKSAVALAGKKDLAAEGIKFDGGNGSPSEELGSQKPAASSGK